MESFKKEVADGERFEFGKNWDAFLSTLTDEKIKIAEQSILDMLELKDLHNKTVIDAGSGSGLFSLAARRLGATVHSFDYDPDSVACTKELRDKYLPEDPGWIIESGSVLDNDFLEKLGTFDIVYSWGVLHHTGDMWKALKNVSQLVKSDGDLYISIYNEQGIRSKSWLKVKRYYCSGTIGRRIISSIFIPVLFLMALINSLLKWENIFSNYKKSRGMSITHDWYDWLGGYPFETAKIEEIFTFYKKKGFKLKNVISTNGWGTNQFVFTKNNDE